MSDRGDQYGDYVRPLVWRRLHAIGLDVEFHRAAGDYLYYRDDRGREVEILDLVGGFGGTLLGHNHPELVATARGILDGERPFLAQGSVRGEASELARRLSARVGRYTGQEYVVTFANSGTEAIEAALKHAELERRQRASAILSRLSKLNHAIRVSLQDQKAFLPDQLFEEARARFGLAELDSFSELVIRISRTVLAVLESAPLFLALNGAFHGKTLGSLQLTHNARFRTPWSQLGPRTEFLPIGDADAIARVMERESVPYLELELDHDGAVKMVERHFTNIAACFVEPIQGEGGVREVPPDYLGALRDAADAGGFPLVMDEIQSGMGRTGTFLASETSGIHADYYVLAKTLSGGLGKISALLTDRRRYLPDFGYVHTSTYVEDDLSSAVALRALDLIEADDDALLERCRSKGDYLLGRLRALKEAYPEQLRDVRGRGLLIGVEIAPQPDSGSALMRVLSEQERLGTFIAGWLFAEEKIRVLPTLSAGATLRIEPSSFISERDMNRFVDALEGLLQILRDADGYTFARYLVGKSGHDPTIEIETSPPPPPATRGRQFGQTHVGFLAHFPEAAHLRIWDRTLAGFNDDDCAAFLARTEGAIEPFVVDQRELSDAVGNSAKVTVIGIPFIPSQALTELRGGGGEGIRDLIHRGVGLARRMGCSVLGFGGYTSILTDNCRDVVASDIAVTSGNSLTAAAAIDAAMQAAARVGLERRVLGIVGAVGNIGTVLAELCAEEVDEIVLVGRERAGRRLRVLASHLYEDAWQRLQSGDDRGVGRALVASGLVDDLVVEGDIGEQLSLLAEEELPDRAPIRIATDMEALRGCNMIISASNAAQPIILAEHLADGPVVISDVAVPRDVDPSIARERPDAVVLDGGAIIAPAGQKLSFDGLALRDGELFGCLAETILLGLAGIRENFSYGPLRAVQVRRIRQLAKMHGFEIQENPA